MPMFSIVFRDPGRAIVGDKTLHILSDADDYRLKIIAHALVSTHRHPVDFLADALHVGTFAWNGIAVEYGERPVSPEVKALRTLDVSTLTKGCPDAR